MTTFGLHLTSYPDTRRRGSLLDDLREITDAMEGTGVLDTLWLTDHVRHLGPEGPTMPMPESHLVLAAVAATTRTIRLGVLAASVVYRNPALLAKMVTTLDVLSGGRAVLGIGAGHPRTEAEHRAYGLRFPSVPDRMTMLDDALTTIRAMTGPAPDALAPPNWPRPANPAGVPVLVAGSGERRLLRIAARHADMVNLSFPAGDGVDRIPHKLDVLARHCAAVGRDPAAIRLSYKALLCVAPSRAEARDAWDAWRTPRGVPDLDHRAGVFVGEPAEVADQVRPFIDAGVEHLVVELSGGVRPGSIDLVAAALGPLVTCPPRQGPAAPGSPGSRGPTGVVPSTT
jgi:alkanesulfonate monooxygenase SsuD/methylene tetrahydromethanopterin reductase-like flavin-dependent oxidoreductase (luciferase family)